MMYWHVGPGRRGLQSPAPSTSTSSSFYYKSTTADQGSSTNSESDDTVVEKDAVPWTSKSHSNGSKHVRFGNIPYDSNCSTSCTGQSRKKENWTLWSVWSHEIDEILEDVHGRRLQIEEETFFSAITTALRDKCPDFPLDSFSRDWEVYRVNKSDEDSGFFFEEDECGDELKIEVTPAIFRLPEKKAETKKADGSTLMISCCGQLSQIFAHVIQGNELLLVQGGVMIWDRSVNSGALDGTTMRLLDLNNVNTWNLPVHIVRLHSAPITDNREKFIGCTLIETIQPCIGKNFNFYYEASRRSDNKTITISRHREIKMGYSKTASYRGPLDSILFPISKDVCPIEAFETLINYSSEEDPAWSKSYNENKKTMKKNTYSAETFTREFDEPPFRYYDYYFRRPASPPTARKTSYHLNSARNKQVLFDSSSANVSRKFKKQSRPQKWSYSYFSIFIFIQVILVIGTVMLMLLYSHDEILEFIQLSASMIRCQMNQTFNSSQW